MIPNGGKRIEWLEKPIESWRAPLGWMHIVLNNRRGFEEILASPESFNGKEKVPEIRKSSEEFRRASGRD
jgi:hypothetical protein